MEALDVVALGELLIDFTCLTADAGGYPTMAAHPGGAPANYLAALAKFGAKTALLAKVGADAFGRRLIATLRALGVETRGIVTAEDVFTTLAFVTLDERGDREFSFARKPGADTQLHFDELDLSLIDRARALHFGSLSLTDEPARETTRRAVEYAKAHFKLLSFDPNLRRPLWRSETEAREQMRWGLAQADVVKLSDEEAAFLFGDDPAACARRLIGDYGVKLVFVTLGAEGCLAANAAAALRVPAPAGIAVRDTTGAGDIFGGSAMSRLLALGKSPDALSAEELSAVARFAAAAATLSTARPGGIESVPELGEVLAICGA